MDNMTEQKRETFFIHNTSRDPRKRDARRQVVGPDRSRLNIRIGGGILEVRRGRPLPVSGVVLRRYLLELRELESKGLVEVYDFRTQRVDLSRLSDAPQAFDPAKVKAEEKAARRAAVCLTHAPDVTNARSIADAEDEAILAALKAEADKVDGPLTLESKNMDPSSDVELEVSDAAEDEPSMDDEGLQAEEPPTNPETVSSRNQRNKKRRR